MVISENAMGKRILIADDSVTIQKAFALSLTGEDFAVTTARSADEGLTLARQTRPDVVIADATMPGRSGYELCASLKADAALRGIPVYILSSNQQPYDEAKGRQVGADGNLLKPWDSTALVEALKEALGRPAGAAAPAATRPMTIPPAAAAPRPSAEIPSMAFDSGAATPPPRDTAPAPARTTAGAMPAVRSPAPTPPPSAPTGGMRPSLIPGVRPGAMPPARPGTSPSRTLGNAAPLPGSSVPPRPASAPMGRTLFGLPAASMPFPGSTRSTAAGMPAVGAAPAPAPAPVASPGMAHEPYAARGPAPVPAAAPPPSAVSSPAITPHVSSVVSSVVDQKVAAIAAKGPEYEALAKLSREVIEQIVWEIVPELAEAIIREQVAKRGV
jgi:CheY-like chemotaxis protein